MGGGAGQPAALNTPNVLYAKALDGINKRDSLKSCGELTRAVSEKENKEQDNMELYARISMLES